MASRETWRAMLPLMVASPALIFSSERSCRRTSSPASEQTWAMPLPICPAPITPTVLISIPMAQSARTSDVCRPKADCLRFHLAEFLLEFRQDREKVSDQAVIRNLKNRRLLVLVDRHDDLGVLHA